MDGFTSPICLFVVAAEAAIGASVPAAAIEADLPRKSRRVTFCFISPPLDKSDFPVAIRPYDDFPTGQCQPVYTGRIEKVTGTRLSLGLGRGKTMHVARTSFPAGWLAILLVLSMPIFAQVDTGVLTGSVTDATEAPVPLAQVTLLNLGTNYKLELVTSHAGLYVSPPLPVGKYRIQTSAVGFQVIAKEVELHVAERLAIDFTLTVGSLSEKVTVTGIGAVLQTETATLNS